MCRFLKKFLILFFMFFVFTQLQCLIVFGEGQIPVGYGGVYTAGKDDHYPVYLKNKAKFNKVVKDTLERLSEENKLPFKILFESDIEERKQEIDNTYTLAVVLTRDDVVYEKFSTDIATIDKIMVNVGIVILLYQTGEDNFGNKRNTVIFSLPIVGYSINVENGQNNEKIGIDDIGKLFIDNTKKLIEEHLAKRLSRLSLVKIEGKVKSLKKDEITINIGSIDGLVNEQRVYFYKGNSKVGTGVVNKLADNEAIVKILETKIDNIQDIVVKATNIKGLSTETYQVVSFKSSSKKANTLFQERALGSQISQWISDFIADKGGKVVLPTKVGGEWIEKSTETSFMVLLKDGQEHIFEMLPPKYPLHIDLTGLASKLSEKNNVSELWLYKAWIKIDIPNKGYSKEFSDSVAKSVVSDIQSFQEKDELLDLIYKLCAKVGKEVGL